MAPVKSWTTEAAKAIYGQLDQTDDFGDEKDSSLSVDELDTIIQSYCPFKENTVYLEGAQAERLLKLCEEANVWLAQTLKIVKVGRKLEPGVHDWASKAAEHINPKDSVARIAAVITLFAEPLITLLRQAKREHNFDARWDAKSCPKALDDDATTCDCGADEFNAKIDAVLAGHAST